MGKFVVLPNSNSIYQALHEAGIVAAAPDDVHRCVIDLKCGELARIYVETYADSKLIDFTLEGGFNGLEKAAA